MRCVDPEEIDAILPQTQCGLCGHGGCMPYAEAIAFQQAPLNLCPPGGVPTLKALGELLQEEVSAQLAAMQMTAKPQAQVVIRENECIGCTKCIQVCPVDAIVGAAKHMHTILQTECTACELCLPACPVDCIDLLAVSQSEPITRAQSDYYRQRFQARQLRLQQEAREKNQALQLKPQAEHKNYLQAALLRAKKK